jgi:hypothetical protein
MGVLALVRGVGRQLALMNLALDRLAVAIGDSHGGACDFSDIALFEKDEGACLRQECCDIGGDKVLVFTESDDDRAPFTSENDALGVRLADDSQGIGAFELRNRAAYRLE